MSKSVYLAGPDVFLVDAIDVGQRKREMCREFGFDGIFPLDIPTSLEGAFRVGLLPEMQCTYR